MNLISKKELDKLYKNYLTPGQITYALQQNDVEPIGTLGKCNLYDIDAAKKALDARSSAIHKGLIASHSLSDDAGSTLPIELIERMLTPIVNLVEEVSLMRKEMKALLARPEQQKKKVFTNRYDPSIHYKVKEDPLYPKFVEYIQGIKKKAENGTISIAVSDAFLYLFGVEKTPGPRHYYRIKCMLRDLGFEVIEDSEPTRYQCKTED